MENNVIEVSQTIRLSAGRLYKALILGPEIEKWFSSRAYTDPIVGGQYSFQFLFHDTQRNHERSGRFLELVRDKKVVYSWQDHTKVHFILEPMGIRTAVTVVHTGWHTDEEEEIQAHQEGWEFFMRNLKTVMEEHFDSRPYSLDMVSQHLFKEPSYREREVVEL